MRFDIMDTLPSASMSDYEKYLRGEPLTEELRELRDGPKVADPEPAVWVQPEERPISRPERVSLKELRTGNGWSVFERLLEKATKTHVNSATLLSKADPLTNRESIANEWAYVGMFERACKEISMLVDVEIAELEKE